MRSLAQSLVDDGVLSQTQLAGTLADYVPGSSPFHHFLLSHADLSPEQLLPRLCRNCRIPELDEDKFNVLFFPTTFSSEPWVSFCLEHHVLPLSLHGTSLDLAMSDPFDFELLEELEALSQKTINRHYCPPQLLAKHYTALASSLSSDDEANADTDPHQREQLREDAVSRVQEIFREAIRQHASDIHIEPGEKEIHVRLRIDGLLQEIMTIPYNLYSQLTCRIKIMANLDIAEKRVPQDGAIQYSYEGKPIEFRVSSLPGVHGENIVLRLLDGSSLLPDLTQIGLSGKLLENYTHLIQKPYGIILVTGPTGSGKTTTLYSTLAILNQSTTNLITIEDPVEYRREGMHQIQINTKAGMTFASALRSILRQDPDIIMVGEMRDHETAEIAIRAALTGHLVLSTLHTNDSPSSFSRLVDMGIAPYLVSSSILGILAQRLVRKICPHCKAAHPLGQEEQAYLAYKFAQYGLNEKPEEISFFKGAGCQKCRGRGYKGRIAVFELIYMDSEVSQAILSGTGQDAISQAAAGSQAYRHLWFDAWDKAKSGMTTVEEMMRIAN